MFSIDAHNNITALTDDQAPNSDEITFASAAGLEKLGAKRLADAWNELAGVPPFGDLKPVKKFENSSKGARRLWEAIQKLAVATPKPARKETARTASKKPASTEKGATKGETILALIRRKDGATLEELMEATGWQKHSVRGFIAGTVGTKMGLEVESTRDADTKARRYTLR